MIVMTLVTNKYKALVADCNMTHSVDGAGLMLVGDFSEIH